jgi:predicted NUDIX family phosphoesterase
VTAAGPEDERVLCVARDLVFPDGAWHGLVSTGLHRVLRIVRAVGEYRPRLHVEDDPGQQQIIPYCIVRHADGTYLLTRRLRRSTERRLHDLHSLGVGGHVNPGDGVDDDPVSGGLRREWREEVVCPAGATAWLVGLLNDDSAPVSAVHLGLVFLVEPHDAVAVTVRETHKLEGSSLRLEEMAPLLATMESWSQLAYEGLRSGALLAPEASPLRVELPPAP